MGSATRIHGALAAAVTPLTDRGETVDANGIARVVDFYAHAGLDGLLILGTTGEGVLLSVDERRAVAERVLQSAGDRLSSGATSSRPRKASR